MTKKILTFLILLLFAVSVPVSSYAADSLEVKASSYGNTYITLSWSETGKTGYVYVFDYEEGDYILLDKTKANTYKVSGLEAGNVYSFKVKSGKKTGLLTSCTRPETPYGVAEKNRFDKKAYISWKSKAICDIYQVKYSTDKSMKKYTTVTSSKKYKNVFNLNRDTTYYVKVRGYILMGGKKYYSYWSDPIEFRYHEFNELNGVTYMDGLLVVNKSYALPSSYGSALTDNTSKAFKKMQSAAKEAGCNIYIASGFRSYSYQKSLYNGYLKYDPKSVVDTYSARPGHSEHQSGRTIDLNSVTESFANTKAGKWTLKNCYDYGFVLRYPEGKEDITGYKYEPWHLRYVGKTFAKKLYNEGDILTIEEYFGIDSIYR